MDLYGTSHYITSRAKLKLLVAVVGISGKLKLTLLELGPIIFGDIKKLIAYFNSILEIDLLVKASPSAAQRY